MSPGRHVRLQFEGWPAIQFSGWPSVAVGSFGGTVAMVDATDDEKEKSRILVVPDEQDDHWPSERFLRQGVQAHGWVLLEEVSRGFEVWRQLNGFPPVVDIEEPMKKNDKGSVLKKAKSPVREARLTATRPEFQWNKAAPSGWRREVVVSKMIVVAQEQRS